MNYISLDQTSVQFYSSNESTSKLLRSKLGLNQGGITIKQTKAVFCYNTNLPFQASHLSS